MIERIKLDLVTPNLPKDNEAIDLSRMEEAARDMGFAAIERTLMVFGPGGWGGNHMHERREAMFATNGDLTFVYRNEAGDRVEESMGRDADGLVPVYFIPSWEPHLVKNYSGEPATLFELRDRISANYANLEGPESLR